MVLGTCFRLLANAKNTDSVTNTAAATVRQVLLHAHTYVPCPLSNPHVMTQHPAVCPALVPCSALPVLKSHSFSALVMWSPDGWAELHIPH